LAATALRPLAVDFMELLAGSDCEVEEFQLSSDRTLLGDLEGRSLADMQFGRRSGAQVLAIRNPAQAMVNPYAHRGATYGTQEAKLITNPGGDVRLAAGQLLVVLGSKSQLQRFAELLGPALESVDVMAD
jgi:voltage-gated potassium channel